MWLVNDNRTIAMSCLPKNGSTSMRNAGFSDHIFSNSEVLDVPVRVAWVRNPIERLVSAYSFFHYLNESGKNGQNTPNKLHTSSWESFIDHILETKNPHWCKQVEALTLNGEYTATISHKFEDIMYLWGNYAKGFLPWQNACTKLPTNEYRKSDIDSAYSEDIELWSGM